MEGDTLTRPVLERKTKFFRESGDFAGNLETWDFFLGINDIMLGYCRKKRLKVQHSVAQTTFGSIVTPGVLLS